MTSEGSAFHVDTASVLAILLYISTAFIYWRSDCLNNEDENDDDDDDDDGYVFATVCGAFLLYISTDYVFDGRNPPYGEDYSPNPLNVYGRSKVEGERERHLDTVQLQDPSIRGIFHFSAKEQMTKYEMSVAMATAFNLLSNHLIPLTEQLAAATLRPINSQLNCCHLEQLNLSVEPRAFTSAITDCLWPFTPDKRWRQTVFH
ncbi:methionine adenosyltransferase 2 subunit beta-like [Perca flavescens]|uniref:methionine adenosyltransferase 2 subunit beta-like n=1 Tax=Perca flavescens TaxID=8167 RepID=UPI00106E0B1E|nr:methionine adenosyltransferase 2 subunit beta-like [Perca flavescens]